VEFEKAKDECTFAPNIRKLENQMTISNNENKVKITEDKFVLKDIERLRKAREEKERVKKFTERGIFLNENHK
jgi:hypothetical protein